MSLRGVITLLLCVMSQWTCAGQGGIARSPQGANDAAFSEAAHLFKHYTQQWKRLAPPEQQFLLGVAHVELGRFGSARQSLAGVETQLPLLTDYVLYYRGRAALADGAASDARTAWQTLLTDFPESRWHTAAAEGLVAAAIARKAWDEAEGRLAALTRSSTSRWQERRLLAQRADLRLARGDATDAADIYYALYTSTRYPSEVARARAQIESLKRSTGIDLLGSLTHPEQLALAQGFLEQRLYTEAIRLLKPLMKSLGVPGRELLAMAHFRAREYPEATKLFATLYKEKNHTTSRLLLLQRYATASLRAEQPALAATLQQQIVDHYPGTRAADDALYKKAYILQDSGACQQATVLYTTWLHAKKRAHKSMTDVGWRIAWCHYQLAAYDEAITELTALRAGEKATSSAAARYDYWRARALEAAGTKDEAKELYATVSASSRGSYYGRLAAARLDGKQRWHKLFMHRQTKDRLRAPSDYSAKAALLHRLGLWDHAVEEMDHQAGAELHFAPHHRYAVARFAERWHIDPGLPLALMRQESAYQPRIVSPAGAIGLMQLIPPTAQQMASELGMEGFQEEDLFRPLPNMRLGLWYLQGLLKRYDGTIPYVLASYNAGEAAVDRWRAQHPDLEIDEFIESIPYAETNDYVKRVLRFYW